MIVLCKSQQLGAFIDNINMPSNAFWVLNESQGTQIGNPIFAYGINKRQTRCRIVKFSSVQSTDVDAESYSIQIPKDLMKKR